MKNIHLLPTDKPSRLYKTGNFLLLDSRAMPNNTLETKNQHIYITNDEEIREGDWVINNLDKLIGKAIRKLNSGEIKDKEYSKIILTTDQDLIKDGVQAIDDDFLEWFVKNPSCEFVNVECSGRNCIEEFGCTKEVCHGVKPLKIIIPKEEPKQETLEEAAERLFPSKMSDYEIFLLGAKYQSERMYSEEEVHKIIENYQDNMENNPGAIPYDKWFEQYKKKQL